MLWLHLLHSIFKASLLRHTLKTLTKLLIKLNRIYAPYYVPKIFQNFFHHLCKCSITFFFFYNNDLQLETKNKPKTYNSVPISMLCDVGGKLNVKNTKYNIKIYLS